MASYTEISTVPDCPGKSLALYLENTRADILDCHFEAYVPAPGARSPGVLQVSAASFATVEGCNFEGDAFLQFQMFSDGLIRNNTFDAGGINILDSSAQIDANVMGVSPLINLLVTGGGSVSATRNVFGGGEDVTLYFSAYSVELHENHIFNASDALNPKRLTVKINNYDSPDYTLDLTNNWWGTTRATRIAEWIRDVNDDPRYNIAVEFEPFALGPLPAQTSTVGELKAGF